MDWFPLWNSLRIAAISSVIVFFSGILAAYYASRLPRGIKGALDVVLTLPLVLPPTVCGWFLLMLFGLTNIRLLTLVTLACYAVFAVFYTVVYRITSRTYYRLVTGGSP